MRRCLQILLAAIGAYSAAIADAGPARAQAGGGVEYRCPASSYGEVRRKPPIPGLLAALFPPLGVFNALTRDDLAKLPTRPVAFRVVDESGKGVPNALVGLIYRKAERFIAEGASGGPAVAIPHGDYIVNAAMRRPDGTVRWGSTEVTVGARGPATVTVKLQHTLPPVTMKPVTAPTVAGFRVPVEASERFQDNATLAVVRSGGNPRADGRNGESPIVSETVTSSEEPADVVLPGTAGRYDIVYLLCAPRIIRARWPLNVTPARVALEAPARAPMGSSIKVTVRGTLSPAYELFVKHDEGSPSNSYKLEGGAEQTVDVQIPFAPGLYDILVRTADETRLAHRMLRVDPAEIAISGPDKISFGASATFSWPKATGNSFRLEVWSMPAAGRPARKISEIANDRQERVAAGPGEYELRLAPWLDSDKRVIGRRPLRIEGRAFDNPPREVPVNDTIDIQLAIPRGFFDRVGFVKRGGDWSELHMNMGRRDETRVRVATPKNPGAYDLVYMIGSVTEKVIAERVPVDVR